MSYDQEIDCEMVCYSSIDELCSKLNSQYTFERTIMNYLTW